MMFKILLIVSLISITGAGLAGYKAGGDQVRAKMAKAIENERKSQFDKIEELIKLTKIKKVIYRDKIKIIRTVKSPTGCFDAPLPITAYNKLR